MPKRIANIKCIMQVNLPKKIESGDDEKSVKRYACRKRSDTSWITEAKGVLTLRDNCEEISRGNASSSSQENCVKIHKFNKKSDRSWIRDPEGALNLRDNYEETSYQDKDNDSSSSPATPYEKGKNSAKTFTYNRRSDTPGGVMMQQELGEEENEPQPDDGSESTQPSSFKEKMDFWRRKAGK